MQLQHTFLNFIEDGTWKLARNKMTSVPEFRKMLVETLEDKGYSDIANVVKEGKLDHIIAHKLRRPGSTAKWKEKESAPSTH